MVKLVEVVDMTELVVAVVEVTEVAVDVVGVTDVTVTVVDVWLVDTTVLATTVLRVSVVFEVTVMVSVTVTVVFWLPCNGLIVTKAPGWVPAGPNPRAKALLTSRSGVPSTSRPTKAISANRSDCPAKASLCFWSSHL